ncbi:MAG: dihydrofolate reductase family protein [Gaiellaceae bacterium]
MRTLVVHNLVSLDGFSAGPGGDLMALPFDPAFDEACAERLGAADTLLLGRTTYTGFKSFWPSVADDPEANPVHREISRRDNEIEKVVVSDTLTPEETEPWRETTEILSRANAHERLVELKQGDGGEILVFGSSTLWNDLLAAGLVDEIHLMVGPVALGDGVSAFVSKPDASLRLLEAPRTWEGSDNVLLRYGVS